MALVHIPTHMRSITEGRDRVSVPGQTLRQVFESLEQACPGMKEQVIADGRIRPEIAVFVDGVIAESGLVERVSEDAEIHLIPALGGG